MACIWRNGDSRLSTDTWTWRQALHPLIVSTTRERTEVSQRLQSLYIFSHCQIRPTMMSELFHVYTRGGGTAFARYRYRNVCGGGRSMKRIAPCGARVNGATTTAGRQAAVGAGSKRLVLCATEYGKSPAPLMPMGEGAGASSIY